MRQNWNHKSHSVGAAPPNVSAFSGLKHMRENISILYTITIWGCLELALKNDIKFVFAWQADKHTHTQTNRLVARQINWNRLTKPTWQCIWAKLPSFGCIKWHKKAKDILMASRLVDLPMASNKSQECQATWNNLSQANDQNKAKGSKRGRRPGGVESCLEAMGVALKALSDLKRIFISISTWLSPRSGWVAQGKRFGFNCWIFRKERTWPPAKITWKIYKMFSKR